MSPRLRLMLGILFAPLGPQLFILFGWLKIGRPYPHLSGLSFGIMVFCYILMLASGLPAHFYLKARRQTGKWDYIVISMVAAAMLGLFIVLVSEIFVFLNSWEIPFGFPMFFGIAVLCAVVMWPISFAFWLIVRPDIRAPL